MKLTNFFKSKKKQQGSSILQILDDKDTWDHPNVIYLAAEIVSEYGTILEKTSDLTMGVSEKHLPYSKIEIEKAIIILLRFLNSQNSWSKLKEKYNDLAKIIIIYTAS
jgi:hypothetical protein